MSELVLYIGNKNYSSWSFRPWIGLTVAEIPFEEVLIPFDDDAGNPAIKAVSPSGKVPVLRDGDLLIPESLAILDHVARRHPDRNLWPADGASRTRAMVMCCHMLSGFQALRSACPMNMRRERRGIAVSDAVRADVARIEQIWSEALHASGGPFLFGGFSIADAMFAPVVNRLDVYAFEVEGSTLYYMETIKAQPAWKAWEMAGKAEPWIVPHDEA